MDLLMIPLEMAMVWARRSIWGEGILVKGVAAGVAVSGGEHLLASILVEDSPCRHGHGERYQLGRQTDISVFKPTPRAVLLALQRETRHEMWTPS